MFKPSPIYSAILLTSALATTAHAEDKKNFFLEEVIVTANKRVQSLQEVPMSVSAFTDDFIEDTGLTDFADIQQYAPNLKISSTAGTASTSVRIRGIGSVGTNAGIDPSVGMFIDGVYQGRAGMSVADLVDIERIEVLRGPQGTLYGKNTAAGAISIITKKPSDEFEGLAEFTYAKDNRIEARGMVNIPLGDSGNATRLSAYSITGDHVYENSFNGEGLNDANKWGIKSRTLFLSGDDSEWLFSFDYSEEDTDCCAIAVIDYNGLSTLGTPTLSAASDAYQQRLTDLGSSTNLVYESFEETESISPPSADPFDEDNYWIDGETSNKVSVGGASLEWNKSFDNNGSLTFINAWRNYESDNVYDGDFTAHAAVTGSTEVELDQYSSELRYASPAGGDWEYQIGTFLYYSEFESTGTFEQSQLLVDKISLLNSLYPDGTLNVDENLYKTSSAALFGQSTWNISEEVSLTFGLRYTYEKKERNGSQTTYPQIAIPLNLPPIAGPNYSTNPERSDSALSPMINLRYFVTEDVMTYASISRGFKSGGFNQRREIVDANGVGADGEFEEEIATNYELGWKGTWLDRRLTVNGTFFYVEYDDFQSQGFDGSTIKVTNAGTMESYGTELEVSYLPIESLTLGTAVGYTHATYSDFVNGECTIQKTFDDSFIINGATSGLAPGLNAPCTNDLTDEAVDNVPEWNVSSYVQHVANLGDNLNLTTRFEHNYIDSFFLDVDLDPNLENDPVNIFNLRLSLADADNKWQVSAWAKNLTDEEYFAIGQDIPVMGGYIGVTAPLRNYGVTLRLNF